MNTAIALIAGQISLPPMIPLIFVVSHHLGGYFVGELTPLDVEQTKNVLEAEEGVWDSINFLFADVWQYGVGAFVLAILTALIFWFSSYFLLRIFRK